MKLSFETRELRANCENQVKAERLFGLEVARRLRTFLADLDAAETLQEIPADELFDSEGGPPLDFEAPLAGGYILRMRVNHSGMDCSPDMRIDRSTVRRLKILEIQKIEVDRG